MVKTKNTVSPYKTLNYFYLCGVPFLALGKRGGAVLCRLGRSRQTLFIPKTYFDDNLNYLGGDLGWYLSKSSVKRKIELYKEECEADWQSMGES